MTSIKSSIAKRFPWVLTCKAWLVAITKALLPVQQTYSQNGEDLLVEEMLKQNPPADGAIYVDVGANHPTRLSNTYRFYRQGRRGVTIEPNSSLLRMHRWVRPFDTCLGVGCGDTPGVFRFWHAFANDLSGFDKYRLKTSYFRRVEWVPVLTLDSILAGIGQPKVFLLSIDVEGLDLAVLRGAYETLKQTSIVIVEGTVEDQELRGLLSTCGFELFTATTHNLVFKRVM